ncbi:hypothetical protein Rhe02_03040 [Rhizocola hellebori]|uniref:Contractile injection system tube protein N-terminal domain-containing protein n=1 Tax=Rhizocola hellebori TaxID=1392758 RepID=A0A8J3Q2H2_9ACTN|nr:hypothetical protein [Rhizocola hellebori]GIH02237.1 hypothetical protein Rhe02_03040 [Rhizocola hellebori]
MERVAFLVDATGERVDCLLNPETVQVNRLAGVRVRGTAAGQLTGAGLSDDPLVFTGGGRTEIRLDVLFDVDLVPGQSRPEDVRALTRKLWVLAENSAQQDGALRPPLVRLVWGKAWNVPGIIAAIAERFDYFTPGGNPRRSWLRMRMIRTAESTAQVPQQMVMDESQTPTDSGPAGETRAEAHAAAPAATSSSTPAAAGTAGTAVTVVGDGQPVGPGNAAEGSGYSGVRFDLVSNEVLGSPLPWRSLAEHNHIDNPLTLKPGTVIFAPPPGTPAPVLPLSGTPPRRGLP